MLGECVSVLAHADDRDAAGHSGIVVDEALDEEELTVEPVEEVTLPRLVISGLPVPKNPALKVAFVSIGRRVPSWTDPARQASRLGYRRGHPVPLAGCGRVASR